MKSTKTRHIKEAQEILQLLDFPAEQCNERSALTFLALLDLKPDEDWEDAKSPLIGITPIMDWMRDNYRKHYAPNTRETIRRQTMHQFVQAGLVVYNPDDPTRAVNSPKTVYQIIDEALKLIRTYGHKDWSGKLEMYLSKHKSLAAKYRRDRRKELVSMKVSRRYLKLSPGAHSQLIKAIIEEFLPRFASGSKIVYVGDTENKYAIFIKSSFIKLGIGVDKHGKMPDVVLYHSAKNWLYLIESVTSHGPINPKRHIELLDLFKDCTADIIFITAFPTRDVMKKYLAEIVWESEVWISDNPDHLIHFDGEKFLGPYNED